jgi:hypothetical protein
MNIAIRFTFALLLSVGMAACGETSGSVLEPIPETTPDDRPGDGPPETLLRVDVLLVREMDTCAIGEPCNRNSPPDSHDCFELENGNGERIGFRPETVRFVARGSEDMQLAEHAQCFRLPIDDDLAYSLVGDRDETGDIDDSSAFGALRQRVYSLSGDEIVLKVFSHDVPPMTSGFVKYENERGIFLDASALEASASFLKRDTDFVFAVTGARDPMGGYAPIVEHCAGTPQNIDQGLAGAAYTWLTPECDSPESLLRHWMFQVAVALRGANDFNDLYDHNFPPCGEYGRNDPSEWWPNPDECSVDPDAPTCDENRCEGTDNDYAGHVLTDHWPRGRDFVGNYCANGEQDFDETDIDVGGVCYLLGN